MEERGQNHPEILIVFLSVLLFLSSCLGTQYSSRRERHQSYQFYEEIQSNVGSPMIIKKDLHIIHEKTWVGYLQSKDGYVHREYPGAGSFMMEIIYTGKAGDIIYLNYREYTDSLARPAFYQELKYDLSQSRELVFKNYRFKIIEANNEFIRFFVEND